MRKSNLLYLIPIIWALTSCGITSEFEKITDISNENWSADSIVSFDFEIKDDGLYDVYYLVKNKTSYPYYNLYFKIDFRNESDLVSDKLHEVILFNKKTGEPYGKGLSGIMEHQFLAFKSQKLTKGNHSFALKQYMRVKELRDVMAVGIKIVKAE